MGRQSVIERFEGEEDHYFLFEGHTHHAGQYQNCIEYFARCLETGKTPKPDVQEGIVTVALLKEILAKHGLDELFNRGNP